MINGMLLNKKLCFDLSAGTNLVSVQYHLDRLGSKAMLVSASYIRNIVTDFSRTL